MGSEVIMRGNVSWYLASVDTARPTAPNIMPAAAWVQFGDSFWDDDGVTFSRTQEIDEETILNETDPVEAFRRSEMKMLAGQVKNFTAEALMRAFNSNAVTTEAPTSTDAGFREMSLDMGITVQMFALLCRVDASPYDTPNVHAEDFRTEIWFPRSAEIGDFETVLSAKASAMVPVSFKAFKSNVAANNNSVRIVDMAHS